MNGYSRPENVRVFGAGLLGRVVRKWVPVPGMLRVIARREGPPEPNTTD